MSIQYTYVAPHLPENKMRLYPTKVINSEDPRSM